MILSRRKVHFYLIAILTGLLPLTFLAGMIGRPPVPVVDSGTNYLFVTAGFAQDSDTVFAADTVSVNDIALQLATVEIDTANTWALRVKPMRPLRYADLLVYWSLTNELEF